MSSGFIDESNSELFYRTYRPDTGIVVEANSTINFNIRDLNQYCNLKKSYLEVKGSFKKSGGALVNGEAERPALTSAGIHGLFSRTVMRWNSNLVEDNSYSHHLGMAKSLLTQSPDYNESVGKAAAVVVDTGNGSAVSTKHTAADNLLQIANFNEGFLKRRQASDLQQNPLQSSYADTDKAGNPSQTVSVRLEDLFSVCSVDKLLKSTNIEIQLTKRSKSECVQGTGANGEFVIDEAKIHLCVVRPNFEQLASLEQLYSSGTSIPWNYQRWQVLSSDSSTQANRNYVFTTMSERPLYAFLWAVSDSANPAPRHNEFVYSNLGITDARLKVNGKVLPDTSYQPDFTNRNDLRTYTESIVKFMNKQDKLNSGSLITPENFRDIYTIFGFDLTSADLLSASGWQIEADLQHPAPATNTTIYLGVISQSGVVLNLSQSNVRVSRK